MESTLFPEEVWIKILKECDVPDIVACSYTCKFINRIINSDYLWRHKWGQLQTESEFEFLKAHEEIKNYKELCMRLNAVQRVSNAEFMRCVYCASFSCNPLCVEDRGSKVVVDIGNKFTWIITPSFGVRRHFTLYGIPKNEKSSSPSRFTELLNGFCTDTVDILGIPNMDVVSPAAALLQDEQFPIVRDFIGHLFHQMGLLTSLQRPNAVLVFCEPLGMSDSLRIRLLHNLFCRFKVSRVCLVSKPLATCAMLGLDTCIVVDSGALCTSVAVILNGKVAPGRWRDIPVGGWHVAENLKQAMQWQPEELTEIPVSYLDALAVKEKCRLSYNFAKEERRKGPPRRENINLRGNTDLVGFKTRVARDLRDLLPEYSTVLDVKSCQGSSSWSVAMGSTYINMPRAIYKPCAMKVPEKPQRKAGTPFWMSREEYILYGCDTIVDSDG
ncbi:hypothetical protein C0J52_17531 [Blattella germanica]|nr:hypothetical protein C0J52_17531 [Blattella germanica]